MTRPMDDGLDLSAQNVRDLRNELNRFEERVIHASRTGGYQS